LPAFASAADIATGIGSPNNIDYYDGANAANNVVIDDAGVNTYTFAENGITESSTSCTLNTVPNPDVVTCAGTDWTQLRIFLQGGNDTVDADLVNDTDDTADGVFVFGGDGTDTIIFPESPSGIDQGEGGTGNDTFSLGGGTGAGNDRMVGGPGNDTFNGGAGSGDHVIYGFGTICTEASPSISVDIDGNADDQGCDGETGDDIEPGVEFVIGTPGPDTITGSTGVDNLFGGDGADVLTGGLEDDTLSGEGGNDRLDGGENTSDGFGDFLNGGTGIDRVLFASCSSAITVTVLLGGPNDGCTDGSGDFATDVVPADIESVTGTPFGDTITGSCFANTLSGTPSGANGAADGNDTLTGDPAGCLAATTDGTEADFMGGGEGNDTFDGDGSGSPGFDTVTYGLPFSGHATAAVGTCVAGFAAQVTLDNSANDCDGFANAMDNVMSDIDTLIGSGEADNLSAAGAAQRVQLFGRAGNDTLLGSPFSDYLDGQADTTFDTLNCGAATDGYRTDGGETITNCEVAF
jgi:Ca2+-binding RTX toxin-like protein